MDFELTAEHLAIQKEIRAFAQERIAPEADANDREERFPRDIVDGLAERGFLGGPIPGQWGGRGYDFISHAIVAEEIGRVDTSMRSFYSIHCSLVSLPLLRFGTENQKRRYLPRLAAGEFIGCFGLTEPDAGSDVAAIRTSARQEEKDWVLNGTKMWIGNAGVAGLAVIYAKTDPDLKHKGISAFLVETKTPGFSTRDIHGKLGLRAGVTSEIVLEDCRVPEGNLLGERGKGFSIAMATLDYGRFTVAAGCVGIAEACIELCTRYLKERPEKAGSEALRGILADMITETEAGRLLVYWVGDLKNRGLPNTRETCIAKYFTSELCVRAAAKTFEVIGPEANSSRYPAGRYWRDARVNTIFEGTSQVQKLIIASLHTGVRAFV